MLRTDDTTVAGPARSPRRLIKNVLRHPLVTRLKAPLRNLWWALRGRGTSNPALPNRIESILFVCLGNICRSPFGSELTQRLLRADGRVDVRCTSAGIRPSQDNRSPDDACRAALWYGVELSEHRPRALTRELMDAHDITVVMEWRQLAQLREAYPEHRDRIFLLSLLDDQARNAYERYNIADPFGKAPTVYQECYARMDRVVRALIARLPR